MDRNSTNIFKYCFPIKLPTTRRGIRLVSKLATDILRLFSMRVRVEYPMMHKQENVFTMPLRTAISASQCRYLLGVALSLGPAFEESTNYTLRLGVSWGRPDLLCVTTA